MSAVTWNIWASGLIAVGGVLVLIGSCSQAWGNLVDYRKKLNKLPPPEFERIRDSIENYGSLVSPRAVRSRVSRRLLRFVTRDDRNNVSGALKVAALALVAISKVQVPSAGDGQDETGLGATKDQVKQALNNAAGWSLVLSGSLAAVVAGVAQFVLALR
jgi:hypothetical protein